MYCCWVVLLLLVCLASWIGGQPVANDDRGVPYHVEETTFASESFVLPSFCKESLSVGKGTKSMQSWYFNVEHQICLPFNYKGDGGNANRFVTQIECLSKCTEDPCKRIAHDGSTLGAFVANESRVSCVYDHSTNNDNCPANYYCAPGANICCRQETFDGKLRDLCDLPMDEGSAVDALMPSYSYFYNSSSHQCERFLFHGFGGNQNRFEKPYHCKDACMKKTCPVGQPFSKAFGAVVCSPDVENSICPEDYHCIPSGDETGNGVCCLKNTGNLASDDDNDDEQASTEVPLSSTDRANIYAFLALAIPYFLVM